MKDNKGFSLVTVIIAVAFIGILGMLVLYIALQNFNMKTAGIKRKRRLLYSGTGTGRNPSGTSAGCW